MSSHHTPYTGIPIIREDFVPEDFEQLTMKKFPVGDILNPEFVKKLTDEGFEISFYERFNMPPGEDRISVHVDGITVSNFGKLIVVFTEDGFNMEWYKKKDDITVRSDQTPMETNFIRFKPEEVDLVESEVLGNGAYVIKSGAPHKPVNLTSKTVIISFNVNYIGLEESIVAGYDSLIERLNATAV